MKKRYIFIISLIAILSIVVFKGVNQNNLQVVENGNAHIIEEPSQTSEIIEDTVSQPRLTEINMTLVLYLNMLGNIYKTLT